MLRLISYVIWYEDFDIYSRPGCEPTDHLMLECWHEVDASPSEYVESEQGAMVDCPYCEKENDE